MSASDRPEPGSPADWLRYAHSDLVLAETPPPTGVLLELLCYHAQQAAEKALKAALLHLTREEPPYTHSLRRLQQHLEQASAPRPLPLSKEAAARLTTYAILSRYPADVGEVDKAEWQQAIADARLAVRWAESVVSPGREGKS